MASTILLPYVCPPSGEKRTIKEEIYSEIQPNPSCGVNKPSNKIAGDQYEYIEPTELTKHSSHEDREDDVKMQPNPSYEVIRGEGNSNMGCDTKTTAGSDVNITPNPAYDSVNAIK